MVTARDLRAGVGRLLLGTSEQTFCSLLTSGVIVDVGGVATVVMVSDTLLLALEPLAWCDRSSRALNMSDVSVGAFTSSLETTRPPKRCLGGRGVRSASAERSETVSVAGVSKDPGAASRHRDCGTR